MIGTTLKVAICKGNKEMKRERNLKFDIMFYGLSISLFSSLLTLSISKVWIPGIWLFVIILIINIFMLWRQVSKLIDCKNKELEAARQFLRPLSETWNNKEDDVWERGD